MATAGADSMLQLPSHMRAVPGSVNIKIAKFPAPTEDLGILDPAEVAKIVVGTFNKAVAAKDYSAIANHFVEEGFWRDHLTVSWVFRTLHTPAGIHDFLLSSKESRDGFRLQSIQIDASTDAGVPKIVPVDASGKLSGIQFFIKVTTVLGSGVGLVSLVKQGGAWKIFTLYTTLKELRGYEEPVYERRPKGVEHGGQPGRKNWAERRAAEVDIKAGNDPVVIVVGAGQAGLTAAARLKMLGINTLVIDQNERVGDNWRKRYQQLVLHDPVWYDHMPYLKFPSHWPIFTPKDKLAQFFEAYAALLELNVWTRTELVHTKWDESKKEWTVVLNRKREDGTSDVRTFHPRHVIQATGHSGKKNHPTMKGVENFRGDRLCHSSEFSGARDNCRGKKAIVVGSCNSAHDIAQDYLEKGYDITIVQRSTTNVVSSKAIVDIALKGVYSEDGPSVEDADIMFHGIPSPVLKALHVKGAQLISEHDKEMLEGLARAGFKVDQGPDDAGFLFKYFQRGGGYYINVGASQLIADGKIKVKQGQEIDEVLPRGLRFADGSEVEADEIVFATGYQNMRTQTRIMFGDEIADKVGDVWGFTSEGEIRTIWQKSGHPGFWFHGGNLALCRYYSLLMALQIKGLHEGLYTENEI